MSNKRKDISSDSDITIYNKSMNTKSSEIIFTLPVEVRNECRLNGNIESSNTTTTNININNILSQTSGQAPGYAQANLVILTNKELAFDFLLFCQRNPKPCPLIAMLDAGQYLYDCTNRKCNNNANTDNANTNTDNNTDTMIDIRTDLPKYRIFKDGKMVEEVRDITKYWKDTFYTFIIGCSFSFEDALIRYVCCCYLLTILYTTVLCIIYLLL